MSIGVVITTFNSESYFQQLYDSIPLHKVDHVVVVNGGEPYKKIYDDDKLHWIQHTERKYASVARNDGLKYLLDTDCDDFFIIEDDILLLDENVFDEYIRASRKTGLEYLCFCSNAWDSGHIFERTPRFQVDYGDDIRIGLFKNMCNDFTYRTRKVLDTVGLYDEAFQFTFDLENVYNIAKAGFIDFWNFPDIMTCDKYVCNNPDAVSRMNPNGERDKIVGHNMQMLTDKHGPFPATKSREEVINHLKQLKP